VGLELVVEVGAVVELAPCDDLKAATAARDAAIEVTASRVVMFGKEVHALRLPCRLLSLATLPLSSPLSEAMRCNSTTVPFLISRNEKE
jgi:hypothetical protein